MLSRTDVERRLPPLPGALAARGALGSDWHCLGTPMPCRRDAAVFLEGDPAEKLYRLQSGAVRLTKLLADGRRQIAGFCLPGEFFALEAGDLHRFSAEAIVDSRLLVFPRRALQTRAASDATLAAALWRMTGACLERAQDHMLLLGRKTALERLATFLLDLAARTERADLVELPMARQDIGDFLGLTIETVSRCFSQLERAGVIALPRAREVRLLDRRRLLQLEG
jgi:CRP/FNR family nitrogen fixation transcriptional regulator